MKQITTLSQLGARLSIAKCHIARLQEARTDEYVNHVLYIVDPNNTKLQEFARSLHGPFTVYDRNDNCWTQFKRLKKKGLVFGGDSNYDFLIRCPETRDIFLTLHDDSMLLFGHAWNFIREQLQSNDFGGYLDTRKIAGYDKLLFDGIPMSSLRVGTWFCFGKTKHYLENGYTLGDYRNYPRWYLNLKFRTTRISSRGYKVWLNGGFDLNIRARLNGDRIYIIDKDLGYAEHWQKITGFFTRRGLLQYADTKVEVEEWEKYLRDLKQKDIAQFEFDVDFLDEVAGKIASYSIYDNLLNAEQIDRFRNI